MKKLLKSFGVILTLCLMCLALFACGSEGVKYNYKETKVEGASGVGSEMSGLTTMYDTMYKDSYIEVGDSDIKWTIKDNEQKMTYEKDGDKYILGGDYIQSVKDSFASMGMTGDFDMSMWGAETEEGFKIVIEESMESASFSIVMYFTKA